MGFIEIWREGNKKALVYLKGLFMGLKKVAQSEDGHRIARKVVLKYFSKGYAVLPVKQSSSLSVRLDIVAIPVERDTWRPIYGKSIAIEVDSCNELETHPEHVVHNWFKESTKDFAKVHI